jgi:hypothetical protein
MTLQDKARVIVRDYTRPIPQHIRQSCQRVIMGKALHEPVRRADKLKVSAVFKVHYARAFST